MAVLIVAEHDNTELKPATLHAVTAGLAIGGGLDLLVAGHDCAGVAEQAASTAGVGTVKVVDAPEYANGLAENMARLLVQVAADYTHVVAPATTFGKDVMPRAAALLDTQQISDISEVVDADTFVRPIYAGNALATVQSSDAVKLITVRTTAFEAAETGSGSGTVTALGAAGDAGLSRYVGSELSSSERPELTSARVVISGGRGMQSGENFPLIEAVADRLGAAVGASRAAVDAGYVPNDYQVGQTGKVVAPELYIAVGISGAIQHLAGMKDSKVIVAINKDEEAPIFRWPTTDWWLTCSRPFRNSRRNWNGRATAPEPGVRTVLNRVGVIGAGQMGSGIAHVCALHGLEVRLLDLGPDILTAARDSIERNLARQASRGRISDEEVGAAMTRISTGTDYADLSDCDIVIEAATESEDVKRDIFRTLTPHLRDDTLVATNTSSISITRLAATTDRPGRFIGMHFMNPVPVMQLVELIRGIATERETFEAVRDLAERLGKTVAEAEDFPAFIVNRILLPMINEAVYTLYEGVGSVQSIDTAMRLGANHPMGPLQLADFIGLDTCLAVMHMLYDGLADSKYRPCPLLVRYVEAGWLGRKAGRGFYDYSGDVPVPTR